MKTAQPLKEVKAAADKPAYIQRRGQRLGKDHVYYTGLGICTSIAAKIQRLGHTAVAKPGIAPTTGTSPDQENGDVAHVVTTAAGKAAWEAARGQAK